MGEKNKFRGPDPLAEPFAAAAPQAPEQEELWNTRHPKRFEPATTVVTESQLADPIRLTNISTDLYYDTSTDLAIASVVPTIHTWTLQQDYTAKIHIGLNSTQGLEANIYGLSVTKNVANGAGANLYAFASEFVAIDSVSDPGLTHHLSGAQIAAIVTAPGNYHELWGAHIYSLASLGGTSDLCIGTYSQFSQTSGIVTVGVGFEADIIRSGGTMGTAILAAIGYHSTHGTQGLNAIATNQYGVRMGPIINGTLNYAWYSEEGKVFHKDQVGIGTDAVAGVGLYVVPIIITGTTQQAVAAAMIGTSAATVAAIGLGASAGTSAAAYTCAEVVGIRVFDATRGAGSTITTQVGLDIANQTKGATNYALRTGSGKVSIGDIIDMTGALTYISFAGISTAYFQVDGDPKFLWSLSGTVRMHLTTAALVPTAAGGLTLGTSALPWGNVFGTGEVRLTDSSNAHYEWYISGSRKAGISVIAADIFRLTDSAGTVKFQISMAGNTGKIIPPSTSNSLRNNADTADNILVEDGGTITFRNQLKFTTGAATSLGTTDAFGLSIKTQGNVRTSWDTSGNQVADTTNGGYITYRAGTSSITAKTIGLLFESNNAATTSTTTATITGGSNGGTYTLKANTLANNGDSLRIVYNFHLSATTGTATLTVGGSTVINAVAISSNGSGSLVVWITRRDSTHFDWTYEGATFNAANVLNLNRSDNVNVDLTADQTINFQGTAASGTFTAHLCQIAHEAA